MDSIATQSWRAVALTGALLMSMCAAAAGQGSMPATAAGSQPASSQAASASQPAAEANGGMPLPEGMSLDSVKPLSNLLNNDNDGGQFNKMLSQVLVIAGIALVAFFVIKKVLPRLSVPVGASRKNIKVLETTYLGPRKTLHLVQVGGKTYLIGSSGDRISLMTEVEQPAASASAKSPEGPK